MNDTDTGEALRYSIVIEWSEQDQAYIVILPEWADQYVTDRTG